MPVQALALALAASIYPPAVAAVIALGRGSQVRSRVAAFVFAAAMITYALGTVMLFVLAELGATRSLHRTPSAAVDVALGVLLVILAVYLSRKRPKAPKASGGSKIERYLRSRRLAFVLGLTLYALPSPIYVGAVKEVADAKLSTSGQLLALLAIVALMLWLIELPMLLLLAVPDRASSSLEQVNRWFALRGRLLAVILSAAAGIFLIIEGAGDLIT
jgi:Sap, sulfolipid-1-addressing protein